MGAKTVSSILARKVKTRKLLAGLHFNWSRWADLNRRPADYESVGPARMLFKRVQLCPKNRHSTFSAKLDLEAFLILLPPFCHPFFDDKIKIYSAYLDSNKRIKNPMFR